LLDLYFFTKPYRVTTHPNCLEKKILMSVWWRNKEILSKLCNLRMLTLSPDLDEKYLFVSSCLMYSCCVVSGFIKLSLCRLTIYKICYKRLAFNESIIWKSYGNKKCLFILSKIMCHVFKGHVLWIKRLKWHSVFHWLHYHVTFLPL